MHLSSVSWMGFYAEFIELFKTCSWLRTMNASLSVLMSRVTVTDFMFLEKSVVLSNEKGQEERETLGEKQRKYNCINFGMPRLHFCHSRESVYVSPRRYQYQASSIDASLEIPKLPTCAKIIRRELAI